MIDHRTILYATIAEWELQQRVSRGVTAFDAWQYLAQKCGFKHASALRNMCLQSTDNNKAKLGFESAIKIMIETNDFRLYHFIREQLKEARRTKHQIEIFAEPLRDLEDRP